MYTCRELHTKEDISFDGNIMHGPNYMYLEKFTNLHLKYYIVEMPLLVWNNFMRCCTHTLENGKYINFVFIFSSMASTGLLISLTYRLDHMTSGLL